MYNNWELNITDEVRQELYNKASVMSDRQRVDVIKSFILKLLELKTEISVGLFQKYYNKIVKDYLNGDDNQRIEVLGDIIYYIKLASAENRTDSRSIYNLRFTDLYIDYRYRNGTQEIFDYRNRAIHNRAKSYNANKLERMVKYLNNKKWSKKDDNYNYKTGPR